MMKDCSLTVYCEFVSASQAAAVQRSLIAEWYELYGIVDNCDTCTVSRNFYCYDTPWYIVTLEILVSSCKYRR